MRRKRTHVWVLCSIPRECDCDILAVYADENEARRVLYEYRRSDRKGAPGPYAACNYVLKECELYL